MPASMLLVPPAQAPPPPALTGVPVLRLALRPAEAAPGLLDGAWWPHSDSLASELPCLVAELDKQWGRITRVTVNPRYWQPLPRRVTAQGHVVRVGWFTDEQDPHKILLFSYGLGRWDLLVIPPRTDEDAAARLMAAATDPVCRRTASALVAAESAAPAAQQGTVAGAADHADPETSWESEGGAAGRASSPTPTGPTAVASGR